MSEENAEQTNNTALGFCAATWKRFKELPGAEQAKIGGAAIVTGGAAAFTGKKIIDNKDGILDWGKNLINAVLNRTPEQAEPTAVAENGHAGEQYAQNNGHASHVDLPNNASASQPSHADMRVERLENNLSSMEEKLNTVIGWIESKRAEQAQENPRTGMVEV